ncbi:hypothetical protein ACFE04_004816 [Oxalis oulophora]
MQQKIDLEEEEEEEEDEDDQDMLCLSLGLGLANRKKRKRSIVKQVSFINKLTSTLSPTSDHEGNILTLLQMREQMLNLHKMKSNNIDHEEDAKGGLQLIHLLLVTATDIDQNNFSSALQNLTDLYRHVSLDGDSVQRVVAYFTDGLAARLLTTKSPFYDMIIRKPTQEEEFLAFTDLYTVSPYYQFAHFTANQAILEQFEKEEELALHVIDFDVSYGFQWPSLIQSLSDKATTSGDRITLRITGFGTSLDKLRETETRLVSFAKGFRNLVFEFEGLLRVESNSKLPNLGKKKNETLAVNLVFHLNKLNDNLKIYDTLRSIHAMNPSILILAEQEGGKNPRTFLSRFMESLHYFAAMFDSLDDCLPLESSERLSIEKNHLGKEIKSRMNYETDNRARLLEKKETWKSRMEGCKFGGVKLSSKSLIQAKLLLKIKTSYSSSVPTTVVGESSNGGGGFRVFERDDGTAISLAWQDRCLLTVSAWHCV